MGKMANIGTNAATAKPNTIATAPATQMLGPVELGKYQKANVEITIPIQPNHRTCRTHPILSPTTPQNRLVKIVTIYINPQILNHSDVVNPTVSVNTIGMITTRPNKANWLMILTTQAIAT